jgi:hypothetical protein
VPVPNLAPYCVSPLPGPFLTKRRPIRGEGLATTSNSRLRWILCGVVAIVMLIFAWLMLPPSWERLRTGHWAVEHFLAYFAPARLSALVGAGPSSSREPSWLPQRCLRPCKVSRRITRSICRYYVRTQRSWRSVGGGATCQVPNPSTVGAPTHRIMNSDNYDLRSGDWVAGIIAGERQRELICFPPQKASRIVTVYRDQGIAYFPARLGAREGQLVDQKVARCAPRPCPQLG